MIRIIKYIALFIALESIITGSIVCFGPSKPCEDGPAMLPCLTWLEPILYGLVFLVIPGTVLLYLIVLAHLEYRIIAIIGIALNFFMAFVSFFHSAYGIYTSKDFFEPLLMLVTSIVLSIQGIGFLFAGLSATFIQVFRVNNKAQ